MTSQSRRSLVYIVADDWRNEAAAAYGQRHMQTPNIDALSRSGLTFDRAYCQLARCAPSRHSFLTGRGPQTTRVLTSSSYFRGYNPTSNEWRTLPEHLRLNGWLTFGMGKLFPSNSYHDEPRSWSPDMAYFGYDMQRCPGIIDPRKLPQIESPTGTWCALEGSGDWPCFVWEWRCADSCACLVVGDATDVAALIARRSSSDHTRLWAR